MRRGAGPQSPLKLFIQMHSPSGPSSSRNSQYGTKKGSHTHTHTGVIQGAGDPRRAYSRWAVAVKLGRDSDTVTDVTLSAGEQPHTEPLPRPRTPSG